MTVDKPHLTHPHNLVGPHCDNGVCTVLIDNEDMRATFTNLGIQCVKKKEVEPEQKAAEHSPVLR